MKNIIFIIVLVLSGCFLIDKKIDESLAQSAEVVLRVTAKEAPTSCSKYCWQKVEVKKVLKNKSGVWFHAPIDVAFNNFDSGIPLGISTIYLNRYNPQRKDLWKLVGGYAKTGVSHFQSPKAISSPSGRTIIKHTETHY